MTIVCTPQRWLHMLAETYWSNLYMVQSLLWVGIKLICTLLIAWKMYNKKCDFPCPKRISVIFHASLGCSQQNAVVHWSILWPYCALASEWMLLHVCPFLHSLVLDSPIAEVIKFGTVLVTGCNLIICVDNTFMRRRELKVFLYLVNYDPKKHQSQILLS